MIRQKKTGGRYYYEFKLLGKRYNGVCIGCATRRAAEAYEKKIRSTMVKAGEQKNVRALIENFRDELTGGESITIGGAYDAYTVKPMKRQRGAHQEQRNAAYWRDFAAFMAYKYPDTDSLANVTRKQAESYIAMLRHSGAFDKSVTFSRGGKNVTYMPDNSALSPRTVNARHKAIKAVFSHLAHDAGVVENPFDIPMMDADTTNRDAFTDDELRLIGENMTMPYIRPVFTIGICTGLTLGDICLLRWSEISGNWITNKQRRKTGARLEIPILPPLAAFLNDQRSISGGGAYNVRHQQANKPTAQGASVTAKGGLRR